MTDLIRAAITMAVEAHAGQVDKAGKPYIGHIARVASRVPPENEAAVITAWLHDTVEDTDITPDAIAEVFGEEIRDAILAVTRKEGEAYADFIGRAGRHPIGRVVKVADLQDNLDPSRVEGRTPEQVEKYTRALAVLDADPGQRKPDGELPEPQAGRGT